MPWRKQITPLPHKIWFNYEVSWEVTKEEEGCASCHATWWMHQKIEKSSLFLSWPPKTKSNGYISHQFNHSILLIIQTLPSKVSNSNCWKSVQRDKNISSSQTYTLWSIALCDHTAEPFLGFKATYQLILFIYFQAFILYLQKFHFWLSDNSSCTSNFFKKFHF